VKPDDESMAKPEGWPAKTRATVLAGLAEPGEKIERRSGRQLASLLAGIKPRVKSEEKKKN